MIRRRWLFSIFLVVGTASVGCGGAVASTSGGGSTTGDNDASSSTIPRVSVDDGGALPGVCAGAVHVSVGGTVHGTTCGGTQVGDSICQEPKHPDAFLYVDAPPGTGVQVTASAGVSVLAFSTCESTLTSECMFGSPQANGGTFAPSDPSVRVFGLEREDVTCGDYTVTVSAQ